MSRSRHDRSGKGPGYEYWSARPGNRGGACPGQYGGANVKTRTHRLERRHVQREMETETMKADKDYLKAVSELLNLEDGLSDWEVEFIQSIDRQSSRPGFVLSQKQKDVIDRLTSRLL